MTPPDHLLAGLSIGTFYASLGGLFSFKRLKILPVIFLCGVFAMLPDADAFRGVYSSADPFTGHRGITHSLFFTVSVSVCFIIIYAASSRVLKFYKTVKIRDKQRYLWRDLFLLLFFSGLSHLVMDLPQPPGVWKGIPLFFPLMNGDMYARSGGWGYIGWYDYRITWMLLVSLSASWFFLSSAAFFERRESVKKLFSACIIMTFITSGALITGHIRHSEFRNSREWNESQRRYIEGTHPSLKKAVSGGRKIILGFIN